MNDAIGERLLGVHVGVFAVPFLSFAERFSSSVCHELAYPEIRESEGFNSVSQNRVGDSLGGRVRGGLMEEERSSLNGVALCATQKNDVPGASHIAYVVRVQLDR